METETKINYENRAKTAIERYNFSRPVKFALRDSVLKKHHSFFDFGCGKGSDIDFLKGLEIESNGFDPFYFPDKSKVVSDIVNLGYVINVIENPTERIETIKEAFSLAKKCLIVSAQTKAAAVSGAREFGDGCVTRRDTFQKYFSQEELKELLIQTLEVTPYPAGPGIFYVFKDEQARSEYLAVRYDSTRLLRSVNTPFTKVRTARVYKPVKEVKEKRLQESQFISELVDWVSRRGRFPSEFEFSSFDEIAKIGVSRKFLENWVFENVDKELFENAQRVKKQDILLMLALTRFDKDGRPKLKDLPELMRHDIKAFFGSYSAAVIDADKLLFSVGNPKNVQEAINRSKIGKKLPDSIYFHNSVIPYLEDILQVFVGCGRSVVGDIEGDVIVKVPKKANGVSFLLYNDFDNNPHPELLLSIKVKLQGAKVYTRDYFKSDNPPILHRKETFVHESYPNRSEFIEVTEKEEKLGLLSRSDIGFKKNWEQIVAQKTDLKNSTEMEKEL